MNEFRGTVRLDQPFLEQPEVAEFLQPSPGDSFPRSALYRLLSVTACFFQSSLIEQGSELQLASLRLSFKLKKPIEVVDLESNIPESRDVESTFVLSDEFRSATDTLMSAEHQYFDTLPVNSPISHYDINAIANSIHEALVAHSPFSLKSSSDISIHLSVRLLEKKSIECEPEINVSPRRYPVDIISSIMRRLRNLSGQTEILNLPTRQPTTVACLFETRSHFPPCGEGKDGRYYILKRPSRGGAPIPDEPNSLCPYTHN